MDITAIDKGQYNTYKKTDIFVNYQQSGQRWISNDTVFNQKIYQFTHQPRARHMCRS